MLSRLSVGLRFAAAILVALEILTELPNHKDAKGTKKSCALPAALPAALRVDVLWGGAGYFGAKVVPREYGQMISASTAFQKGR
jgi:hypothetical protein